MSEPIPLEDVIEFLNQRQLRATYGAVAEVAGRPASFLMTGIPRALRYSWIVNQKTLLPTGYGEDECHPALRNKSFVLRSGAELRDWLGRGRPGGRAI